MVKLLAGLALVALGATPAAADEASDMADRMLQALGGRAVWAAATGTINESQQNRASEPAQVLTTIWMDFRQPRFRVDHVGPGFRSSWVIDGERSWSRRPSGEVATPNEARYAEEMRWYGAHLYRSIHRLAARDPALSLRIGSDQRLEVVEGGRRLIWFRLDPRHEPYSFGQWDDEVGSICGPWEFEVQKMRHPVWVAQRDGSWRAAIRSLVVSPAPTAETFARPQPGPR